MDRRAGTIRAPRGPGSAPQNGRCALQAKQSMSTGAAPSFNDSAVPAHTDQRVSQAALSRSWPTSLLARNASSESSSASIHVVWCGGAIVPVNTER